MIDLHFLIQESGLYSGIKGLIYHNRQMLKENKVPRTFFKKQTT